MADIFDEVEAELKAERAQKLLVKYGAWLFAAALAFVAAAAGWQVWNWYRLKYDRATAAVYLDAMFADEQGSGEGEQVGSKLAEQDFARVIRRGPDSYRTLARLQQAALLARSGDRSGAAAMWTEVAADGAADPLLRQLASLLLIEHQLDTGNPEALRERLAPLLAPGNPWRSLAEEAAAVLDLRQGRTDEARHTLQALSQDATAPAGVRQRAGELLGQLSG